MPELIDQMTAFLEQRGIPFMFRGIEAPGFLPGLQIEEGVLVIDRAKLSWPGDILHEAGHIALTPASRRNRLGGKLEVTPAEEMAALAWSYAAALEAGIDPAVVFHEGGYQSGSSQLLEAFTSGRPPGGPGVPMLQWYGMTTAFPRMTHWLRPGEDPA